MGVKIMAEAGFNHMGDLSLAKRMADAARDAEADCIIFRGGKGNPSFSEENNKTELTLNAFAELKQHCRNIGIDYVFIPQDVDSIHFFYGMDMEAWRISFEDMNNAEFLIRVARTGKPVIMSTGMKDVEEIRQSLLLLLGNGCGRITLLHGNSAFPVDYEAVHLKEMLYLKEEFDVELGYSDHTVGIETAVAAVALGAGVIEKHFVLERKPGRDEDLACATPEELARLVKAIRNVEKVLE